jgi:putative membrane protein
VSFASTLPYCGAPPDPVVIWQHWNFDPGLVAALFALAALYAGGVARGGPHLHRAWFYAGWAIASLALVSPLCALSVSLFAARVAQHMVLALVAAPLVALGRPVAVIAAAFGVRLRGEARPLAAAAVFAAMIWLWHAPEPYAATFRGDSIYWLMHITTFGASVWLWTALLDHAPAAIIPAALAALASTVQMGLLGALITLAPAPLYTPHLTTTIIWGLTSLQDQQLGGAVMWIPGCLAFLLATLASVHQSLSDPADRRRPAGP